MNKRVVTAALLAVLALAMTVYRELVLSPSSVPRDSAISLGAASRQRVQAAVDSALRMHGAGTWRRSVIGDGHGAPVRTEVRVTMPAGFQPLRLIAALKDSVAAHGVTVASTENPREKTVSIHLLLRQRVVESIVVTLAKEQKGAPPSASKKPRGRGTEAKEPPQRKARR